jgi:hypothetical protein
VSDNVSLARLGRVGRAVLVVVGVAMVSVACAADAKRVLPQLKLMPVVSQPPPGGIELARVEDEGTLVGRQAGIAVVYVSSRSAPDIVQYYLTTYRAYSLEHDNSVDYGSAAPPGYAYIGSYRAGNVEATVVVRIQLVSPYIPEGYDLTVKRAPAGATTFVTVNVIGFVPASRTQST